MTTTTRKPPLSAAQKLRLASAMQEALAFRQRLYMSRITDAPERTTDRIASEMERAENEFYALLAARGFRKGDVVKVAVDGPFKGKEAQINAMVGERVELRIDGITCAPLAAQVTMVKAKTG